MIYRLAFQIDPQPKLRPRFDRRGIARTPDKTRQYETALRFMAMAQWSGNALLVAPIRLKTVFILTPPKRTKNRVPCVRPDLDNYIKAVKDVLNGIAWVDDGQVVELIASKIYGEKNEMGSIHIEIEELK